MQIEIKIKIETDQPKHLVLKFYIASLSLKYRMFDMYLLNKLIMNVLLILYLSIHLLVTMFVIH